jgi:hypothetical protein
MKNIILAFFFFLVGEVVYSQSSTLVDATVSIVPAVGTATILEEAIMPAENLSLQAVQTRVLSSAIIEKEAASIRFRVFSNTAVYAVSVLPFPERRNFVQQKDFSQVPVVSINTVSAARVHDVYSVTINNVLSPLASMISTPVAPQIVVHFN